MSEQDEEFDEEETEESEEDNSELESEFEAAVKKAEKEVKQHIKDAEKALAKAEKVAEKYGVPIRVGVSPIGNSYIPDSFEEKFGKLDRDTVTDISGVWDEYGDFASGWVHSAVC